MTGHRLGNYEVLEKLGQGGMGVVYKARDTRLERFVAIKFLSGMKHSDADRKRRFLKEAQAASALNHSSIIVVHELGESDGTDFIVMEYVPGRTLAELIPRKGLKLDEILRYAIQMADALACAHAAGILHRDLKPYNVMVTDRGLVKILDFGLAKLMLPESGTGDDVTRTLQQGELSQEGAIIGTPAYLSPEQAESKKLDARSDIFSFGVVMYEMATGQRAFERDSLISTLSAITRENPTPLRQLIPDLPREFERVIERCLRKDPERRFQHMSDLKVALEDLKQELESGALDRPPLVRGRRNLRPLALGTAVLLAAAGLLFYRYFPFARARAPASAALSQVTFDSGATFNPAISRNGALMAYSSDRAGRGNTDIWLRQLNSDNALRLTTHEADDYAPEFFPDGTNIVYRSDRDGGGLYTVPTLGGDSILLAAGGREPRVSPGGNLIAYSVGKSGDVVSPGSRRLYVVSSPGGTPRQLAAKLPAATSPVWSPDGRHLLFTAWRPPRIEVWLTAFEGGDPQRIDTSALDARGLRPYVNEWSGDYLYFSAERGDTNNLWRARITPSPWRLGEPIEELTSGTGKEAEPRVLGQTMFFTSYIGSDQVWGAPLDPDTGTALGKPEMLASSSIPVVQAAMSGDGRTLLFQAYRGGQSSTISRDLRTGRETPVNLPGFSNLRISPDGKRIASSRFADNKNLNSKEDILVTSLAGGAPRVYCEHAGSPTGWRPDGSLVLFETAKRPAVVGACSEGGHPVWLLSDPKESIFAARFSPDGKWLAFHARNTPESRQVFIAPFNGLEPIPRSEWIPVTDGKQLDRETYWSEDGRSVYFMSDRDGTTCFWLQRLEPARKTPVGAPVAVLHIHGRSPVTSFRWDLSARHIIFLRNENAGNVWMTTLPH